MTDTGSIRSSDGACSSIGDERERFKIEQKIADVKEKLKSLNEKREAEVEKFLSATRQSEVQVGLRTDNPQIIRIRSNFERQNKRYTHETEMYQKKLIEYEERLRLIDNGEYEPSPSRTSVLSQGIRKAGANMKGMTETVMTAPIEFANKIKNAFGSADNVNVPVVPDGRIGQSTFFTERRSADGDECKDRKHTSVRGSSTLPPNMSFGSTSSDIEFDSTSRPGSSADANLSNMMQYQTANNSLNIPMGAGTPLAQTAELLPQLNEQLKNILARINSLEEKYTILSKNVEQEIAYYANALEEERFKITKIDGVLNETIEFNQAEFASLKEQNVMAMKVDFQHNDKFKNLEERIESVQNHMIRLENSLADALAVKVSNPVWGNAALSGANILVELLKIVLFIVATALDVFRPLAGSRNRSGVLLVILILLFFFGHHLKKLSMFVSMLTSTKNESTSLNSGDL